MNKGRRSETRTGEWRVMVARLRAARNLTEQAAAQRMLVEAAHRVGQAWLATRWRREEAEDLVQDVLSRALTAIVNADEPLAFFLTALSNRAKDSGRSRRHQRRLRDAATLVAAARAEHAGCNDRTLALDSAVLLGRLPGRARHVLDALVNGATVAEVAKDHATTAENVYQMRCRARKLLNQYLAE